MKVTKINSKKSKKNTLYTGKGDLGTTTLFHCDQGRISKSADIIEALGALDELNAYLGIVKVYAQNEQMKIVLNKKNKILFSDVISGLQQTLFIIQAELAGSEMTVEKSSLNKIESIIKIISESLPPITSFTVSGGSLLSAELDFGRTLARRCERRVIAVLDDGVRIGKVTIAYLNRLSSVLFALSRYANYFLSIKEEHPKYNKK
ncbi:MAG: cob(I)yrinic acid a,c-diamide adenosyltransferase [Candidatus Paceibacterota bacterium]|jgi:cob(I)alamin adenosyltransferase